MNPRVKPCAMPKQSVEKRIAVIGAPLLGPIRNRFNEALARYAGEQKNWRFVISMEEAVPGTFRLQQDSKVHQDVFHGSGLRHRLLTRQRCRRRHRVRG